jgi:hypothetical protein
LGQIIDVEAQVVGDIALFDTNRSVTGQDGEAFDSAEAAADAGTLPGALANRLFAADGFVRHVFVLSNGASVRREHGWDDEALADASEVIRTFFVYYRDGAEPQPPE